MQQATHSRVLSIALALLVLCAAWLAFEYGQRPAPANAEPPRSRGDEAPLRPSRSTEPDPVPAAAPTAANSTTTYKCQSGGRVSFGDQPCRGKEKTLSVTVTDNLPPLKRSNRQEEMRAAATALEASRLARERQYAADLASSAARPDSSRGAKDLRCVQIDRAIAEIDALMRQPHGASAGDYWNGQRKKLYDERFSVAC